MAIQSVQLQWGWALLIIGGFFGDCQCCNQRKISIKLQRMSRFFMRRFNDKK